MGNRGNIIFTDEKEESISPTIYLHWNGSAESIYGFLDEMDRRNIRCNDIMYESARFIQLVGEFFDKDTIGSTSLGVTNGPKAITPEELGKVNIGYGDNGFFIIHRISKGKVRVRRFIEDAELSEEEVEREKSAAVIHNYHKEFQEIFKKIQGNRKIEEIYK